MCNPRRTAHGWQQVSSWRQGARDRDVTQARAEREVMNDKLKQLVEKYRRQWFSIENTRHEYHQISTVVNRLLDELEAVLSASPVTLTPAPSQSPAPEPGK